MPSDRHTLDAQMLDVFADNIILTSLHFIQTLTKQDKEQKKKKLDFNFVILTLFTLTLITKLKL